MIILIADDDTDDLEFFIAAVAEIDASIRCITALNGIEALKILDEGSDKPNLIFLDLNMPKMDGMQCLKLIKGSPVFGEIPVIMYSTSNRPEDIAESKEYGASAFIIKPNKFRLLKNEIWNVLQNLNRKTGPIKDHV